jgi:cobalt-zinc-cadmium efflux system membrane fusion protein
VSAAEAQIDSSRQRLDNFGKTEAEIEQLAETRHADRTTRVMAPIGGLIVGRKVGPGQYIRPDNPDPLFTVADTSTMWLLAQLYESQILIVRAGQKVEVKVLALPNQSFPAQVSFIAPAIDPATRRVAVRCVVRNKNNQLRPEMFASFRFEQAPRRALLVPQKAVVREGNLAVVWVLEDGSHISRRPVELGGEIDGDIEIKSGLRAGETVVADGALFLSSFVKG